MDISKIGVALKNLSRQLFPEARAFKMPPGGIFDRLDSTLDKSMARGYNDALSVPGSMFPNSPTFTTDDAARMELDYGIYSAPGTTLTDRKAAILQAMQYPGTVAPRCTAEYIQDQLRLAGFDVYLYENRFPDGMGGYITKTPSEILGISAGRAYFNSINFNDADFNEDWATSGITLVANYLEESKDAGFTISPNYRSTFYIAGAAITDFANVPAARKIEFRQLILQLKPQQTCGILFISFV